MAAIVRYEFGIKMFDKLCIDKYMLVSKMTGWGLVKQS